MAGAHGDRMEPQTVFLNSLAGAREPTPTRAIEKKILVIQHAKHEGPGIIEEMMRENGFSHETFFAPAGAHRALPSLYGFSGLLIMGGPQTVYQLKKYVYLLKEMDLVHEAGEMGIPTLGICLGAQIIAQALGGDVFKAPARELGWYDINMTAAARTDPLFSGSPNPLPVFHWHSDTFNLPKGAILLGSSDQVRNQAFRVGNYIYALQFHLEVSEPMIYDWIRLGRNEFDKPGGDSLEARIREETPRKIMEMAQIGRSVFRKYLGLCDELVQSAQK
jgi:GMP synthase (glutamine-hydrolysing)